LKGCASGECFNRLGTDWTDQRIERRRDPYLRARVPHEKIARDWKEGSDNE